MISAKNIPSEFIFDYGGIISIDNNIVPGCAESVVKIILNTAPGTSGNSPDLTFHTKQWII